jgi:hypothetical protein
MEVPVTIKSNAGSAAIVFSSAMQDSDGRCHCDVSLSGRYSGVARLGFHPGESCLVTFLRNVIYDPPIYRTDRHFDARGSGVGFGISKHDDDGHITLTVYMSSREELAGVPSVYWRVETTLVLRPEQVRQLADDLSNLFGYGKTN